MPNWKKIIVSGSDALLNKLTVSNGITGSLFGTASYALTSSYAPNLTISGSITSVNYIDFNTGSAVPAHQSGRIFWDNTDGALSVYNAEADITLQVGQENWVRVYNASGVLITDGTPVRLVGSHGDVPEIQLAQSVQISGSIDRGNQIIGLATHDIEINTIGYVTTDGIVRGLNTNVFSDGDRLFVSSSAGEITNISPSAPYEVIPVGVVVKAGPGGSGIIYVSTQQPIDFSDLSSVLASGSYHSGDLWVYNQPLKRWEHTNQLTGSYAVTGSWSATSFTGSLLGTASYATQALSASYYGGSVISSSFASTASYVLNAVSASFASTTSFVNTLNQNVIITGSLAVGTSSLGASENTITLGARDSVNEGGQIGFNAPGGTYTSASMLDNWQNNFRILRGTNASSDATVASWNLHTKQMQLPQYTNASSFVGTATANLAVDSGGNIITVSTTGGTVFPYTGNAVITGSLTATTSVIAQANGAMYFRGGDDAELWDINVANTVGVYGQQDQGVASVKLGSGGGTISGRSGSIGIGTINPTSASLTVNGNVWASSFTGSLQGTATTASYYGGSVVSASFASTSSYVLNAVSASFAPSTPAFPFTGSAIITGSLNVIGNTTITGSLKASGSRVYIGPATNLYPPIDNGMDIVGPYISANHQGNLEIFSNTTGADNGGSILLGGMQTGGLMYGLAKIVSGYVGSSYGGYLSFWTEAVSSTLTEKMRITSTGLVGIGTTTPTAVLHLKAGSATANTAPLKLTAGTNLTTPEAGAVEFDGTNLFFTTGSTRQIAVAATSALTSSRIPYATTNGRLIDSANLTYGATANTLHVEGGSTNTLFELTRAGEITYKYNINSSNALNITTSTSDTEYYFLRGNKFGIGVSATARLHIVGGTATANTAPIKLTAGTNLTTPEAGTIEFNGNNLFFTTGSTRSTILTNTNPASITGNLVVTGSLLVSGSVRLNGNAGVNITGNTVITGSLLLSGSSLVAGYNPTPLAGTIQDGVTSVLGNLYDWNSNFYQGTVLYSETAASTITFGQLCYRTQNETWDLADATAANSAAAYNMLGICVKSSTATNPTSILINGFVETAAYATIVKSGEPLYMATTPGSMTKTAPTTSGNAVRLIGNTFWDSNTNTKIIIHFNPDRSWIELT